MSKPFLCINPGCLKYFDPAPEDEVISNNNGSFCTAECKTEYDEHP